MNTKQRIQLAIGSIAFVIWSVVAYNDPAQRAAYLTFVISVVTTLSALVLRDMPAEKTEVSPNVQPQQENQP